MKLTITLPWKKLTALQDVVNLEINKLRSKRTKLGDNSYGEERLK